MSAAPGSAPARAGTVALVLAVALGAALLGQPGSFAQPSAGSSSGPATLGEEVVDEVHWTYTGPTSVALDWRGAATDVRYGLTADYGSTATAGAPSPMPWSSAGPFREVEITGLAEDTVYHYSIGGGPDHTFATGPGDSYRFVAVGDISESVTNPPVGELMQQIGSEQAAFVLALGDLTYANYHCQAAVDQHFIDAQAWSFDTAYMPVWGNHEYGKVTRFSQPCAVNDNLANYKGRFLLPNPQTLSSNQPDTDSPPGCPLQGGVNPCQGEDWYWFDAGPVRYVIGPEPFTGAVEEWQQQARAIMASAELDPGIRYVVTASHRPSYSSAGRTTPAYTTAIDALGDEFPKYVLHLVGHVHTNEVFLPQHGVTHVTAGAGGEGLDKVPTPLAASQFVLRHNGYAAVDVSPDSLTLSVVCGPHGSGATAGCTPGEVVRTFAIQGAVPHASWDATCTGGTCDFDGSASTDREGPLSYAWDFGSGGSDTGATPSHTFSEPGVHPVTLTVTDTDGQTDQRRAYVTTGDQAGVTFRAAVSTTGKARQHTVTIPAAVRAGDGLIAVLSTNNPSRDLAVPAGWQLVDTQATPGTGIETFVLQRVATAGSAGSTVPLTLSLAATATATVLAYDGTAPSGPIGAWAMAGETVRRAAHTTPSIALGSTGAGVASYWADRSGTTASWALPAEVIRRTQSFGTGTGHTSAVAADVVAPAPAGTAGSLTATASSASSAAMMLTVLLAPGA